MTKSELLSRISELRESTVVKWYVEETTINCLRVFHSCNDKSMLSTVDLRYASVIFPVDDYFVNSNIDGVYFLVEYES